MDEPEVRKKRYCMICHSFKPERCHHCSRCKKCILGMDHHCPWLGCCIGFFNRKHFILLLIYTVLIAMVILGFNVVYIIKIIKSFLNKKVLDDGFYEIFNEKNWLTRLFHRE